MVEAVENVLLADLTLSRGASIPPTEKFVGEGDEEDPFWERLGVTEALRRSLASSRVILSAANNDSIARSPRSPAGSKLGSKERPGIETSLKVDALDIARGL